MRRLKMSIGVIEITATRLETATADALDDSAPFEPPASTWGHTVEDVRNLSAVSAGDPVRVERLEDN